MSLLNPNEQQMAENAVDSRTPLPAGSYKCRVFGVEKWSNGSSLVWKFKVAKGEKNAGREIWDWTGLSEQGIWKTKAHITGLGFKLNVGEDEIVGTPCVVMIEVGTRTDAGHEGEQKNKVVSVVKYEGELAAEDKPLTEEDEFTAAFGADAGKGLTEDDGLL